MCTVEDVNKTQQRKCSSKNERLQVKMCKKIVIRSFIKSCTIIGLLQAPNRTFMYLVNPERAGGVRETYIYKKRKKKNKKKNTSPIFITQGPPDPQTPLHLPLFRTMLKSHFGALILMLWTNSVASRSSDCYQFKK